MRGLTGLPSAHRIPWVLSLTDLMAVTDLLQGAELVHFVTRRLRLEALELVEAHDELDWVGNYLRDGLYFDGFLDGPNPPGRFRLLSFTEDIDSWYFSRAGLLREPAPKPCQKVPLGMSRLLRRLEAERPAHWLTASTVLLNGDDDSRRTIDAQLAHTQAKANADGWSNASQVFLPHYGVTFWTDFRRQPRSQIAADLASYMTGKMAQHNVAFWVGVGLGTDGALVVGLVVTGPSVVADALLRPLPAHDLGRSDTADPDHDAPTRTPWTPKTPPRGFST